MSLLSKRRGAGGLLIAWLTLVTPTSYADTSTSSNVHEDERLQRLESRLSELETLLRAAGHLAPENPTLISDAAPAQMQDSLEQRLATLEKIVAALVSRVPAAQISTEAQSNGAQSTARQRQPVPQATDSVGATTPSTMEAKGRLVDDKVKYLPSYSYAGGALHYGETEQRIQLHAFLDLEYIDAGSDGSRSGVSTFDNHHANVFVRSRLGANLLGHIEIEYEHSGDTVEIDQAYLEWGALDWLSLRAGRFYTPFGIERFVWYSPTNALVSRPAAMRQIVPGNFYAGGLVAMGVLEPFEGDRLIYEIAITDGLGDDALRNRRGSRQTRDNNSSRAVSGRLGYAFGRSTEIGTSYHHQRYSTDSDLDLTFLGYDFSTRWMGWELRAEWVNAVLDTPIVDTTVPVTGIGELEQDGGYAQLAYSFQWNRDLLPELRLISRYDFVDLDRNTHGNDDRKLWSVGVNLLLLDHLRTKFEYQFASEEGPERDDDTFSFQMVLDF